MLTKLFDHLPLLEIPFAVRVSEDLFSGLGKLHEIGHKAQNATFAPVHTNQEGRYISNNFTNEIGWKIIAGQRSRAGTCVLVALPPLCSSFAAASP